MSTQSHEITELPPANVAEVLKEGKLTLIDFWASWCGPCSAQSEILERDQKVILNSHPSLQIFKMNVDTDEGISDGLSIDHIPNLVVFYKNKIGIMKSGSRSAIEICNFIDGFIKYVTTDVVSADATIKPINDKSGAKFQKIAEKKAKGKKIPK